MNNIYNLIKKKYIQISNEKYIKIKALFDDYFDKICRLLKINNVKKEELDDVLVKFIKKTFDPKKAPQLRLKLIESLPTYHILIEKYPRLEEDLNFMKTNEIFLPIRRSSEEYLLLTPEGAAFYIALLNSKKYENIYRLNTLILERIEKKIYYEYRYFLLDKFKQFNIQKEKDYSLGNKDIAILLFFLINGSIGKERAFTRAGKGSEKALNCIVHAFDKNLEFTDELRNDERVVPIRVLQSDLSLLQKKIGYPIYNEKSTYFIKKNFENFLFNVLQKVVKKKDKKDLKSRWDKLLKEYNYWRPILRQNNVCFYDFQIVEKLEKILFNN